MKNMNTKKIAALQPREKRYSVAIDKGLTLRIQPSGTKSFVLRVCKNGRVTDVTLGHFPEISLSQARQKARRQQKELSINPIRGYTLKDAFVLWCNLKRGRIVSYAREKRCIERYIISKIGSRQLDEITAPLAIYIARPIENAGKQSTLKHVLMRLREIMDLAVCAGYIEHNPLTRVSKVFAPPKVTPMPSLHWKHMSEVMDAFKYANPRLKNFFLFTLCSMLRPGEAAKLEKSWLSDGVIIIPASQMKKRREHRVPVTQFMMKLLEQEKTLSPHPKNKFIFSGRKSNCHISKQSLAKWLHTTSLKNRLVPHGFRSMARVFLAEQGVQFEISESCLSHCIGDRVYQAYQRSDFLEQRKAVMEMWSSIVFNCAVEAGLIDKSFMKTND